MVTDDGRAGCRRREKQLGRGRMDLHSVVRILCSVVSCTDRDKAA